jgi:hypothetical protein
MHLMIERTPPDQRRRLVLLGRLQDAEDSHDIERRGSFVGVTASLLDADKARWSDIGYALASAAAMIRDACVRSAFCGTRPTVDHLTARLSEAIDDQLDRESWAVVDAAARLAAGDR